jgi:hypothetical protein
LTQSVYYSNKGDIIYTEWWESLQFQLKSNKVLSSW